jgi:hypothetical protein
VADQSSETGSGSSAANEDELGAGPNAAADEVAQSGGSGGEASDEAAATAPEPAETEADTTPEESPASEETPAGWFQDPNVPNQQRYWDGSAWTDQTKAAEAGISTTKRSSDERKALLAQQLQSASARGLRIESQSDFQAVMVEGQPVNHVLHAIITIVSCGLWGIVWIILAITGGEKREMVVVDEFGNVQLQKLGKA